MLGSKLPAVWFESTDEWHGLAMLSIGQQRSDADGQAAGRDAIVGADHLESATRVAARARSGSEMMTRNTNRNGKHTQ